MCHDVFIRNLCQVWSNLHVVTPPDESRNFAFGTRRIWYLATQCYSYRYSEYTIPYSGTCYVGANNFRRAMSPLRVMMSCFAVRYGILQVLVVYRSSCIPLGVQYWQDKSRSRYDDDSPLDHTRRLARLFSMDVTSVSVLQPRSRMACKKYGKFSLKILLAASICV